MEEFFSGDRRAELDSQSDTESNAEPEPTSTPGRGEIEAAGLASSGFAQGVRLIQATERLTRPVHLLMHQLGADEAQCDMLLNERSDATTLLELLGGTEPPLLLCRTPDGVGFFARDTAHRFESAKVLRLANTLLEIGIPNRTVRNLLGSAKQVCKSDKDVEGLNKALIGLAESGQIVAPKSGKSGLTLTKKSVQRPSGSAQPLDPSAREVDDLLAALDQALDEGNDEFVAQIRAVVAKLEAPKPGGLRILNDFWRVDPSESFAPSTSASLASRIRNRLKDHDCLLADQERKQRADARLKELEAKGLRFEFSSDMQIAFADGVKYVPAVHANLMLDCLDQLAGNPAHDPHFSFGVAKLLRGVAKPDDFDAGTLIVLHAVAGLAAIDSSMTREEATVFASHVCKDAFDRIIANCDMTFDALADAADPYRRSCAHALHRELKACLGKQKLSTKSLAAIERMAKITKAEGSTKLFTIPRDAARALVEESNPDLLPVIEQILEALAKQGHQEAISKLQCLAPYLGEAAAGSNGRHLLVVLTDHPNVKNPLYLDWAHAIRRMDDAKQVFELHLETIRLSTQLEAVRQEDTDRLVATRILISRSTIAVMCLVRSLEIHVKALDMRFDAKSTPAGIRKAIHARVAGRAALRLEELESYARSTLDAVGERLLAMAAKPKLDASRKSMLEEVARLGLLLDSVWRLSS